MNPETGAEPATGHDKALLPPADVPVLDAKALSTRFPIKKGTFGGVSASVHAVEKVSFTLRRGETLSIVGESGCGKSTAARSIMRLATPTGGSVHLEGHDLLALDTADLRRARQHIQMIFQDPFASLNPRMRIGEAIAEPILINAIASRQDAHDRVAQLLEEVGLDAAMAKRYPHEFSGGQRQRICIARALAMEPKVIIADEAVSALDVSVQAQVLNLLMRLQRDRGISYLFISHDMAVVERVSHRVAVMYLGEIVEIGSREAIFENPQHPYTKRLLSAVPVPDPTRRGTRHTLATLEIKSPIRDVGFVPPERHYNAIGADHWVME